MSRKKNHIWILYKSYELYTDGSRPMVKKQDSEQAKNLHKADSVDDLFLELDQGMYR